MNFPKLQMLIEAKKRKSPEMDFDLDTDEPTINPKKKKVVPQPAETEPVVDKATVLSFLKSCDAKCRADVKKKLDKMVEADMAYAE